MKCPECEAEGADSRMVILKKRVRVADNAVEYYDEAGEFHSHNSFSVLTPMECSRGHKWEHHSSAPCPTCRVVMHPAGTDQFGQTDGEPGINPS